MDDPGLRWLALGLLIAALLVGVAAGHLVLDAIGGLIAEWRYRRAVARRLREVGR